MNQSEIVERRNDVMEMLLKGNTTYNIYQTIHNRYSVSRPTVDRDISKCYDEIKKNYERELPEVIATHIGKYDKIHSMAMELYDFRSAIASLQAIEKLLKLHVDQPLIAIQQNHNVLPTKFYEWLERTNIEDLNNLKQLL